MTPGTTNDRLTEKTPEASFLHVLQAEFNLSLREAREVVTDRTIERDICALKTQGHSVQTCGQVKGAGRGQTHKVRIIELWLDRQGYERIALWAHHSVQSIKRYIATFQRVVTLHREQTAVSQIAFLVGASERWTTARLSRPSTSAAAAHWSCRPKPRRWTKSAGW